MLNLFPGLNPAHPLPSMTTYLAFLAERRSAWLLLDLALASHYFDRYFALNQAVTQAEQRQDIAACAQLKEEAGRAWDLAASYAAECRSLSWDQRN